MLISQLFSNFPYLPPKKLTFEEFIWLSKLESRGLKSEQGGAEISRGGTTWKLIRKGSENNIRQEGFGSMDQNRSTFSTANIGRWQSTFTNGSASHGFKKEKKEVGRKKEEWLQWKAVSQKKQQQRKLKDPKEGNFKLKTFQHSKYWQAVRKEITTHILNVILLV